MKVACPRAALWFAALWLAAVCSAAITAPAVANDTSEVGDDDPWSIERFEWTGEWTPGIRIVVVNLLGNVHARTGDADQTAVNAVLQSHEDDGTKPEVTTELMDGRLEIKALWSETNSDQTLRGRVDLTIFVPPGAPFEVRTDDGLIQAKKLKSDIDASSGSGEINISTYGTIAAKSTHGRIHALLASAQWSSPPRLESVTGQIELWLPRNANATLSASTTGLLTTDYSIEVETDDRTGFKHATAKLGEGRDRIEVRSQKGHLMLLRSPIEPMADQP